MKERAQWGWVFLELAPLLSRLEQGAALHTLREELESLHQSEKEELEEQKRLSLARLKEEAEALQQREQRKLEEENQSALSELRERLSREQAAVSGFSLGGDPPPCYDH